MGKYSEKVTFAGQRRRDPAPVSPAGQTEPEQEEGKKTNWGEIVDKQVDVVQAMMEHAGVVFAKKQDAHSQLRAKCPYPGCTPTNSCLSVWPTRSKYGQHYHCRECGATGDIIKLLQDVKGWTFVEVLKQLGIKDQGDDQDQGRAAREPEAMEEFRARERERRERLAQQLDALRHAYTFGLMQANVLKYARPGAYLAERGFTLEQAQHLGIGYIPAPHETGEEANALLWAWQGRIIFPLTGRDGLTFAGRTLALWEPGMTPDAHKAAIEAYNERIEAYNALPGETRRRPRVIRVLKTSPCGFFGFDDARAYTHWHLVEGEFDAWSLRVADVPAVVSMGIGFDAFLIPASVERVTLAMDADAAGQQAVVKLRRELERAGLVVDQVAPAGAKDWNDMLIAGQLDAIRSLFALPAHPAQQEPEVQAEQDGLSGLAERCYDCGASIVDASRDFFYVPSSPDGPVQCFCSACRDANGRRVEPLEPGYGQSSFEASVKRMAEHIGASVTFDPAGYTIEDRVREIVTARRATGRSNVVTAAPVIGASHDARRAFLDAGERAGYPRVQLTAWSSVAPGVRGWQAYAASHDDAALQQVLAPRPSVPEPLPEFVPTTSVFWYKPGLEHVPVPKNYQHVYSDPLPSAQEIAEARTALQQADTITPETVAVYDAWLSSSSPVLVTRAIERITRAVVA